MKAGIVAVEYHLPERVVDNHELARAFPEWTAQKIEDKLGIAERHVADEGECSSDLAVKAAEKLFDRWGIPRDDVDYLLLCTESPDYFIPTTACILQDRLHLRTGTGALDINLGCSGFVYCLGLAKGLIETGQARNVLVLTAETFSKVMNPHDKSVRTLLGDAATATLVAARETDEQLIGPFSVGTDGSGAKLLIIPAGGMRLRKPTMRETRDEQGNVRTDLDLYMDGPAIYRFTLRVVYDAVQTLLRTASMGISDVDYYVFHQANKYMLDELRKKLVIPEERFCTVLRQVGNTGSSTIPIALREIHADGRLRTGQKVMLVGFGEGLSWGACLIRWSLESLERARPGGQHLARSPIPTSTKPSAAPAAKQTEPGKDQVPDGDYTAMLRRLLAEVLQVGSVGSDQSLATLGIDSISAMTLQERIRNAVGVEVPLMRFLADEPVRGLADFLEDRSRSSNAGGSKASAKGNGGTKWEEGEI